MAAPQKPITPPQGVSKTDQTAGRLGTRTSPLGPTPVGVHGPDVVHQDIASHRNPPPVTPNPHIAETHTPAVGVRNTPTKKGK